MKSKRPTQADVARQAGVSRSTVSLVLNQTESRVNISEETRKRVLAVAKVLGYTPNPVAQMLARGRTHIIGVFPLEGTLPYTSADFYYPYLVGIEREAANQDYNILLFTRTQKPDMLFQNSSNSLRLADGLVLTGNYPDSKLLRWLQKEDYPFVLIGRSHIPLNEIDTIVNNHQPTSFEATRHLIDLNHHHLGLLVDDLTLAYHQERLTGCQQALHETPNATLTILGGDTLGNEEIFANAVRQNNITALLCADRKLIAPAINILQKISWRIPNDLSLVFLVSNTWDLPFSNPTRVNLNRDIKGSVAVQRLVNRLNGTISDYQQTLVPCNFVVGDTTAPRD
jgi:DNA-binding LacI/PurR family transcriptional regulator